MSAARYALVRAFTVIAALGVGGALPTTSRSEPNQTNCLKGDAMFPSLSRQTTVGLTEIQKTHLALLKKKSIISSDTANLARYYVFSWFKFNNKFSIIGKIDCDTYCPGSMLVDEGNGKKLYDVTLSSSGGILLNVTSLDSLGNELSYDSDKIVSGTKIKLGILDSSKKSIYALEQVIAYPTVQNFSLFVRKAEVGDLPDARQRDIFKRSGVVIKKLPLNNPGLPKYYKPVDGDCAPISLFK